MRILTLIIIIINYTNCFGQSIEKCKIEISEFDNILIQNSREWDFDTLKFVGNVRVFENYPKLIKQKKLIYFERIKEADKAEIKSYEKRLKSLYDILTMRSQDNPVDPRKINDTTFIYKNFIWFKREISWMKKGIIPILIEDEDRILKNIQLTELENNVLSRASSLKESGQSTKEIEYFPFFQKPIISDLSLLQNKYFIVTDYGKTFKSIDLEIQLLHIDDDSDEPNKSYERSLSTFLQNFTNSIKSKAIKELISNLLNTEFTYLNTKTNEYKIAENKIINLNENLNYATLICGNYDIKDTLIITSRNNINSSFIKGNYITYFYDNVCIKKAKEDFLNKKIPKDYYSNPKLKTDLINALKKSLRFKDFAIMTVVLNENSEWKISRLNKYSTLIDKRELFAGALVKSKKTSKCYFMDNILFQQKNDQIRGFIYEIEAFENPEYAEEYPCILNY